MRRRDERDVHVHPDAARVPAPSRHRAPVRGARAALLQIDAEVPRFPEPIEERHAFAPSTIDWAERAVAHFLNEAADLESEARERYELARQLRDRSADLAAWLRLSNFPVPEVDGPQAPRNDDYPPLPPQPAAAPEPVAEPQTPEPSDPTIYRLSAGWLFQLTSDQASDLGHWRLFRRPPSGTRISRTVTATDGARYIVGQFTDESGHLRDISWLATAAPEPEPDADQAPTPSTPFLNAGAASIPQTAMAFPWYAADGDETRDLQAVDGVGGQR